MSDTYFPGLGFKADQPIHNELLSSGYAMGDMSGVRRQIWNGSMFALLDSAGDPASHAIKNLALQGGQIAFPATQVPSADPNTYDDYKEINAWTAAFAASVSGTITVDPSTKTGAVTKSGRIVHVSGKFGITSVSSPSGILVINGLPYTCASGQQFDVAVQVYADSLSASLNSQLMGLIINGTAGIQIFKFVNGTVVGLASDVIAGAQFRISATYFAAN